MVSHLGKVDADVYIYISEGDKEYYPDFDTDAAILEQFNELALSINRLQQEVYLSSREAKRVFVRRSAEEFTSQSDIYTIEGLAKISLQRLKDHIHRLRYPTQELPGMEQDKKSNQGKEKGKMRSTKSKRKGALKQDKTSSSSSLFSSHEMAI